MRVYMDNHATTRVDPRVVEAMLPYFTEQYGNAGSIGHEFGEHAREAVEQARATIAAAVGAHPAEIVFTSGATESNNLAINGVATRRRRRGDHLVSVATEHAAVLGPLRRLEKQGHKLTLLPVEPHGSEHAGRLPPKELADALTEHTCLASVMLANNEIGVVQPIAEMAQACRDRGVLLHCDATQAVGRIPVNVAELGVDLMSFTAHKLYGPKGIGALYVRGPESGVRPIPRLDPQIVGGGQQQGRRSGTLNTPGIIGFAKAVEIATASLADESQRITALRDELWHKLHADAGSASNPVQLCGPRLSSTNAAGRPARLPGNLNVWFPGVDGEALLMRLPGLAVSSGAACSSTDPSPSHVLQAIGLSEDQARSSLRFGLGRFNTAEDVEFAAERVSKAAAELRRLG